MSESHEDVKVARNPFSGDKHKANFASTQNLNKDTNTRPQQVIRDTNINNTQYTDTAQSINLGSTNDEEKKSATHNKEANSKIKYADAHSLDMK